MEKFFKRRRGLAPYTFFYHGLCVVLCSEVVDSTVVLFDDDFLADVVVIHNLNIFDFEWCFCWTGFG